MRPAAILEISNDDISATGLPINFMLLPVVSNNKWGYCGGSPTAVQA